jgi:hypothetical protein
MNRGIIQNIIERIKALPPVLPLALIVTLLGLISFGLGRLSALSENPAPEITISQGASAAQATPLIPGGQVVASARGKKYHFPWCPGAETISAGNRVWFKDAQEARKRGYTPAGNCKGLE